MADGAGISIGVEFTGWWFSNPNWREIVGKEFPLGIVDWGIYWPEIEPERGKFDFSIVDQQIAFARANGLRIRAQALVFPAFLPDWLLKGNFSRDELIEILRNHVSQIVSHYKGKVAEWVVVNEPYLYPYRPDIFYETIGWEYIDIAFQAAREADSSAVLIYNDSNNHTSGETTTQLTHEITQRLKSKSLIDGVGLQMHILQYSGWGMPQKDDVIRTMQSYGVPVYITEFDVNLSRIGGTQEERYALQARIYKEMLEACLESGICKSFSVWGIGDKYSWLEVMDIPDVTSPNADPTLFDDSLQPKPAYYALRDVLSQYALDH